MNLKKFIMADEINHGEVPFSLVHCRGLGELSKYVSVNNGCEWMPIISFFSGGRLLLERLFVEFQIRLGLKLFKADVKRFEQLLSPLVEQMDGFKSAFFINTSWYKDTEMVGVMAFDGGMKFVKIFKDTVQATSEYETSVNYFDCAQKYFHLVKPCLINKSTIMMDVIGYSKKRASQEKLFIAGIRYALEAPLERGARELPFFQEEAKGLLASFVCCEMTEISALLGQVEAAFSCAPCRLEYQLCHGDYTPWNAFVDMSGKLTLVDYELSAVHGRFYDVFHLLTQSLAVENVDVFPQPELEKISVATNMQLHDVYRYFALYLIEVLAYDCSVWLKGREYLALKQMILLKWGFLRTLLAQLQENKND